MSSNSYNRRSYSRSKYSGRQRVYAPKTPWGQKSAVEKISDVASVAGKALSIATNVAALVNVEHHYHDAKVLTDTAHTAGTPTFINLSLIAQGNSQGTRVGNSIKILSEYLKVNVKYLGNSGTSNNMRIVRLILFRMNDYCVATPTIDMILKDGSTAIASTISPLNEDRLPAFTVLMDKRVKVNGDSNMEGEQVSLFTKKEWHMTYSGGTAAVTDQARGSLYLLICGDADINYNYWSRLHYVDN